MKMDAFCFETSFSNSYQHLVRRPDLVGILH